MPLRTLVILALLSAAACGGGGQDEPQSRTPNPSVPREGIGAGGDMGPPARDMPGKGRGDTPKGKP